MAWNIEMDNQNKSGNKKSLKPGGLFFFLVIVSLFVLILGLGLFKTSNFERQRLKLGYSSSLGNEFFDASLSAAAGQDFNLAEDFYYKGVDISGSKAVLGLYSEIVDVVFPEKKLEIRLDYINEILLKQPTFRDAILEKAVILYQLQRLEEAKKELEKAIYLDPNNKRVKKIEKLLKEGF